MPTEQELAERFILEARARAVNKVRKKLVEKREMVNLQGKRYAPEIFKPADNIEVYLNIDAAADRKDAGGLNKAAVVFEAPWKKLGEEPQLEKPRPQPREVDPNELELAQRLIQEAQNRFREKNRKKAAEKAEREAREREMQNIAYMQQQQKEFIQQLQRDKDYLWVRSHIGRFLKKLGNRVKVEVKHPEALVDTNWDGGIQCRRTNQEKIKLYGTNHMKTLDRNGNLFYYHPLTLPYKHAALIVILRLLPPWNDRYVQQIYPPTWVVHKYPEFQQAIEELENEDRLAAGERL